MGLSTPTPIGDCRWAKMLIPDWCGGQYSLKTIWTPLFCLHFELFCLCPFQFGKRDHEYAIFDLGLGPFGVNFLGEDDGTREFTPIALLVEIIFIAYPFRVPPDAL